MKVLTFGEIMLRLKAPGHERFFQSPSLEATFGGGEANVAVSLANYGMDAAFLTVLPKNDIAEACVRELRYFGVDTSRILRGDGRMGIYYLQGGANQLPSKVVYDRAYSAIALARPGDIDWDKAFDGVDWFHITGITVSCDLNYRKNLWKYGKAASEVMNKLAESVDVAIANEEDVQKSLGITADVDVESGSLEQIFERPTHPYTLGLFGALPKLNENVEWLSPIEGLPPDPTDLPAGCRFHPRCKYADERCRSCEPVLCETEPGHLCRCLHIDEEGVLRHE